MFFSNVVINLSVKEHMCSVCTIRVVTSGSHICVCERVCIAGFGLHTFVLYTGPYIVQVAVKALACNTADFDMQDWRDSHSWKCPESIEGLAPPTFTNIFWKIQMACFLWGVGTAIGELPPYFISRAAAQAGEKLAELEEVKAVKAGEQTMIDRAKAFILVMLQQYGFFAVLACASVC